MTSIERQEVDVLLQTLVALVNDSRLSFHITLHVDGTILTGRVIAVNEYVETMKEIFATSLQENLDKASQSALNVIKQVTETLYTPLLGDAISDVSGTTYIHMKNVHALSPSGLNFEDYAFPVWRFKLSAIDGWMIG